jgi:hypothetical protein
MPRRRKVRDLREVSGRRSQGLVVLLFVSPFELPQRLTGQIARASVNRIGDPGYCSSVHPIFHERQRAPNVQEP